MVAVAGLAIWSALLYIFFGSLAPTFSTASEAVLTDLAMTVAFLAPALFLVRRAYKARIAEQTAWTERLRPGLEPNLTAEGASTFDLLVEASQQVPNWLSIRRGDRYNRHPFLSTAAFIAGSSIVYLTAAMLASPSTPGICYLWIMLAGFAAILAGTLYRIWAIDRRERQDILERWDRRIEESKRSMEELLGGL